MNFSCMHLLAELHRIIGDTVIIKNVGAATVTVGRAGNNINSVAADATMPVGNAAQLVFTGDATIGWTVL